METTPSLAITLIPKPKGLDQNFLSLSGNVYWVW